MDRASIVDAALSATSAAEVIPAPVTCCTACGDHISSMKALRSFSLFRLECLQRRRHFLTRQVASLWSFGKLKMVMTWHLVKHLLQKRNFKKASVFWLSQFCIRAWPLHRRRHGLSSLEDANRGRSVLGIRNQHLAKEFAQKLVLRAPRFFRHFLRHNHHTNTERPAFLY